MFALHLLSSPVPIKRCNLSAVTVIVVVLSDGKNTIVKIVDFNAKFDIVIALGNISKSLNCLEFSL
jgi:hypothetical protein